MAELVFLKLGGSLITDKTQPYTVRPEKLTALAKEIHSALSSTLNVHLVLGHGSGSFGHYAVKEHAPHLLSPQFQEKWAEKERRGFAEVWYRASQLNRYVLEVLHEAGLAAMSIQPSASIVSKNGVIEHWELSPLESALQMGIVPVIYGDVAFDSLRGGAVLSTEALMFYLARHLQPKRILLAGLEAAVWADFPARRQRVEKVTPSSYKELANKVGASHGVDVTGGMKSKVEEMLSLVERVPDLNVQIFSGEELGNVRRVLTGEVLGTLIEGD
ncbi:MAG TPA: isopentenyl phosphate kinase [Anaerolineales bacterium]|nr:isopentenyl phosphate kinase [Anaerolineales bacterium]